MEEKYILKSWQWFCELMFIVIGHKSEGDYGAEDPTGATKQRPSRFTEWSWAQPEFWRQISGAITPRDKYYNTLVKQRNDYQSFHPSCGGRSTRVSWRQATHCLRFPSSASHPGTRDDPGHRLLMVIADVWEGWAETYVASEDLGSELVHCHFCPHLTGQHVS